MTEWPPIDFRSPAVTADDVHAFEQQLGAPLPDDYRAFLIEVNGGQPTKDATFRLGSGKSTVNGLHGLNDPDDMSNLIEANHNLRDHLPPDLLAIGADDGGAPICLCVRGEHRGEVWYFDTVDARPEGSNPRVAWHDRRDFTKLADTFRGFISSLAPR